MSSATCILQSATCAKLLPVLFAILQSHPLFRQQPDSLQKLHEAEKNDIAAAEHQKEIAHEQGLVIEEKQKETLVAAYY